MSIYQGGSLALVLCCHCIVMFVLYYWTLCYVCQENFNASLLMCSPVLLLCPADISWSASAIALLPLDDIACAMLLVLHCQLYFLSVVLCLHAFMLSCFDSGVLSVYPGGISWSAPAIGISLKFSFKSLNAAFLKLQSTPLSFHRQNLI